MHSSKETLSIVVRICVNHEPISTASPDTPSRHDKKTFRPPEMLVFPENADRARWNIPWTPGTHLRNNILPLHLERSLDDAPQKRLEPFVILTIDEAVFKDPLTLVAPQSNQLLGLGDGLVAAHEHPCKVQAA